MSIKIVVDTSILIDHLRGGKIWENFTNIHKGEDIKLLTPTIVVFELFSGQSSKEIKIRRRMNKLLENLQLIELDAKIARKAGEIFRDSSKTFEVPDYIVAAVALLKKAKVLTLNQKDFQEITGLKLEKI